MEVSTNKKWTNKTIIIISAFILIGLYALNTSRNIYLRNNDKKATINLDSRVNEKIKINRKEKIKSLDTNSNTSVSKAAKPKAAEKTNINNSNIDKKISINKNEKLTMKNKTEKVTAYNNKLTSRGGYNGLKYSSELNMEATAYTSSYSDTGKNPGDPAFGITASGTRAKVGTVAVDPSVIPLGTKLYIKDINGQKDYGYAVAEDTGGAIKNIKIDLYFNTEDEAIQFGRREVKVYILK